jgi:hypothetical protein
MVRLGRLKKRFGENARGGTIERARESIGSLLEIEEGVHLLPSVHSIYAMLDLCHFSLLSFFLYSYTARNMLI